ncbi:MAG TPA: NRDE family protein [Thermoanaerobaculia bacterium]|nr:NRDE family protein [Thermoanaerobaculia bacterium]
MCLIAIAHRASDRFPLVIAANRDEDYDRATHDAHFWSDAPEVLGGRDAVAGGSWLAMTRSGRFAAVTNLRAAERKTRSRGALVRDFVTSDVDVTSYANVIARDAEEYAGFHLLAGAAGGEAVYVTPEVQTPLAPRVHAFSNAPAGEVWPKMTVAVEEMSVALRMDHAASMLLVLMEFLRNPRGTASVESEVFIAGDRYGTRASTVIVVTHKEILFGEQSFTRGGIPYSKNRVFRIPRG